MTFEPVDLRPLESVALPRIVLLIQESPGTTVEAEWTATSTVWTV
jgi:hypothetical protein